MQKSRDGYLAIVIVLVIASFALFSQYYTTGAVGSKLSVLPELEIVSVETSTTDITTTIQNIGQGTKHRFAVNFYEREKDTVGEEAFIGRQFFKDGLNDKDPVTFTIGWKTSIARNGEVIAILDPEDYIREVDESNNEKIISYASRIIAPDLYISYLDIVDNEILLQVSNTGSDFEKEFVINTYLINDEVTLIKSRSLSSFGASETFNIPFVAPDKPYTIRVIVDDVLPVDGIKIDRSQIAESNEDNNVFDILIA